MNAKVEKIKWIDGDETETVRAAASSHDRAVVTGEGNLHVSMSSDERSVGVYVLPGCSDILIKHVNTFFKPDPKTGDSVWSKAISADKGAKLLVAYLRKQ